MNDHHLFDGFLLHLNDRLPLGHPLSHGVLLGSGNRLFHCFQPPLFRFLLFLDPPPLLFHLSPLHFQLPSKLFLLSAFIFHLPLPLQLLLRFLFCQLLRLIFELKYFIIFLKFRHGRGFVRSVIQRERKKEKKKLFRLNHFVISAARMVL